MLGAGAQVPACASELLDWAKTVQLITDPADLVYDQAQRAPLYENGIEVVEGAAEALVGEPQALQGARLTTGRSSSTPFISPALMGPTAGAHCYWPRHRRRDRLRNLPAWTRHHWGRTLTGASHPSIYYRINTKALPSPTLGFACPPWSAQNVNECVASGLKFLAHIRNSKQWSGFPVAIATRFRPPGGSTKHPRRPRIRARHPAMPRARRRFCRRAPRWAGNMERVFSLSCSGHGWVSRASCRSGVVRAAGGGFWAMDIAGASGQER